jgi:hypothetical protein
MRSKRPVLLAIAAALGCGGTGTPATPDFRAAAEQYFRSVYACAPPAVAALAADSIVVSYPIFDSLFGTPAIRGRTAVSDFSARFCSRWSNPQITIHDAVQDGNRVVLVWGFQAVAPASGTDTVFVDAEPRRWGGITYLRFDSRGLVVEEIGEESAPGPAERVGGRP